MPPTLLPALKELNSLVGLREVKERSVNLRDAVLLERERVTVTNMASTMVTLVLNSPALDFVDLSSLRVPPSTRQLARGQRCGSRRRAASRSLSHHPSSF